MKLEELVVCGEGIMAQIKSEPKPMTIRMSDYYDAAEHFLAKDLREEREYILYMGGTLRYGRGCKTLNQVHYARISAIKQAKFMKELFGIKQRIEFNYAPVEHSRQPWKKRRNQKH